MVLGASFGLGFTKPVLVAVITALPTIIFAGVIIIIASLVRAKAFSVVGRVDLKTGYSCTVPGGVTVMPVLAERFGVYV